MEKIIDFTKYQQLREIIKSQCERIHIWHENSESKKINDILDNIIISIINSNLSYADVIDLIHDINTNNVIDTSILFIGGNLWEKINIRWRNLAKNMFERRPIGIGTPNAASGEGELMFLFLAGHKVSKPSKGDLLLDNKKIELKGIFPRIQGSISGDDFRKRTIKCANLHHVQVNKSFSKKNIDAVELEKKQWSDFYVNQFQHMKINQSKSFCNDWLKCIDEKDHTQNVNKVFVNGEFNFELFKKEIVKILFEIHLQNNQFDYYVILGDGNDVKVISSSLEEFTKRIDDGSIELSGDYFRVCQRYPIGWYIK